jgi:Ser/Thr protein kinase RdoA (MazF antagonist)
MSDRRSDVLPVLHSLLDPAALLPRLTDAYGLPPGAGCQLLARGVADLYWVDAAGARYVLRVFSTGHRTRDEIEYELDLIEHAGEKGVPVAAPRRMPAGGRLLPLSAPEGERLGVLYERAPGVDRPEPYPDEAYGRAVASLHAALDDYAGPPVKQLDFGYLVRRCLARLEPFLGHRPDGGYAWLERLADALEARLEERASALEWGPCHGDCRGGNAMFQPDGTITLIDYELCGHGWRAYDVAVFLWSRLHGGVGVDERWATFLRGYRAVRPLAEADLAAVDLFVPIRQLFWMGEWADHADLWGLRHRMTDQFYDAQLAYLARWLAEHPDCLAAGPGSWSCALRTGR